MGRGAARRSVRAVTVGASAGLRTGEAATRGVVRTIVGVGVGVVIGVPVVARTVARVVVDVCFVVGIRRSGAGVARSVTVLVAAGGKQEAEASACSDGSGVLPGGGCIHGTDAMCALHG